MLQDMRGTGRGRAVGVVLGAVLIGASALATRQALSQEKGGEKPKIPDAGSPMDEMMKKMEKLGSPGPHHKHLEPLIGQWSCVTKFWMEPGAEPEVSKATMSRKWVLGGRFVMEEYEGEAMGKPFSGMGLMGYDNMKKQYQSVWMDSMSTAIMTESGACNADGKEFELRGEHDDPMTEQPKKTRSVLRIESKSKHVLEMFSAGPDGKDHKNLEITFTRK